MKELFGEWMANLKKKMLAVMRDKHDPAEIAAALGMPKNAITTLILAMAREGSIRITGIEPNDR